ncbi:MAG: general secretion pathway protein GspK [Phycisphaerales bacterium]|nr:general secretion pathway protein GspK [Phycisphaerales bacterium]
MKRRSPSSRAFATLLVLAVVILAMAVIGMVQATAFSQAASGRDAMARTRAYWAARAGLESTIARLEWDTQNPDPEDAYSTLDSMAEVAEGRVSGATWRIATTVGKEQVPGPADEGAKLNVNRLTQEQLLLIEPFMTEDVADGILDWVDEDDDTRMLGAEVGYYQGLSYPYEPRNAPFRSIAELELVTGTWPEDVRGEDWNLNGILDPNEDDGNASWPPDNADGILQGGWSAILTTASIDGGLGASGSARLDLTTATDSEIVARTGVTTDQARVIVDYMQATPTATLGDFIRRDLQTLANVAFQAQGGRGQAPAVDALSRTQLGALLDEASVGPSAGIEPGKLNINSCDAKTIEYLPEIDATLADAIIAERAARPQGFTNIVQLLEVPGMSRTTLATMQDLLTVRSSVYALTCRGKDELTGVEVEITATMDRSSLPVVLKDVRVR